MLLWCKGLEGTWGSEGEPPPLQLCGGQTLCLCKHPLSAKLRRDGGEGMLHTSGKSLLKAYIFFFSFAGFNEL